MMESRKSPIAFAVGSLSIALFSVVNMLMKGLVIAIGSYNAMLWRTLIGTVLSALVYFTYRRLRQIPLPGRAALRIHVTRGTVSTFMLLTYFWGLARVPLAQGIALAFIAPIIALLLAALILKERISRRIIWSSLVAFGGVLLIVSAQSSDGLSAEQLAGTAAVLFGALCYAWNIILMRQQALVADPWEVAFFLHLVEVSILLCAAPFLAVAPDMGALWAIGAAATLVVASQMLMAWSYARAEANYLAPVEYTAFVWGAILGYLAFGETISFLTIVGTAMIVAACLASARTKTTSGAVPARG
jgi:S-adenosylmethionine uptake transporter